MHGEAGEEGDEKVTSRQTARSIYIAFGSCTNRSLNFAAPRKLRCKLKPRRSCARGFFCRPSVMESLPISPPRDTVATHTTCGRTTMKKGRPIKQFSNVKPYVKRVTTKQGTRSVLVGPK